MGSADWWSRHLYPDGAPASPPPARPFSNTSPTVPRADPIRSQREQAPSYPPPVSPTDSLCPSCRSTNYSQLPSGLVRCFECNYTPSSRHQNSTSGLSAPTSSGAKPAGQVQDGGYNPTTIVGRA